MRTKTKINGKINSLKKHRKTKFKSIKDKRYLVGVGQLKLFGTVEYIT